MKEMALIMKELGQRRGDLWVGSNKVDLGFLVSKISLESGEEASHVSMSYNNLTQSTCLPRGWQCSTKPTPTTLVNTGPMWPHEYSQISVLRK